MTNDGSSPRAPFQPFPLYFITQSHPVLFGGPETVVEGVVEAMEGGARLVQYRDKDVSRREMYEVARRLRDVTTPRGVTLIINDHVDLALAVGAEGVHLGQADLPIWAARKILGNAAVVGISTHNLEQAMRAQREGADYIGLGPIFQTHTKQMDADSGGPLGVDALTQVKREVGIPLYAIGGIQRGCLPEIMAAGADGVAAISAFSGAVRETVRAWIADLEALSSHRMRGNVA